MEHTCQVIPFPGNRTPTAHQPTFPTTIHSDRQEHIAALLRESLPPGSLELLDAFRGLASERRAALIGMARAASGDRREQNQALDRLYSALTPAERLHLDAANGKLNALVAAFAEKGD